MRHAFVLTTALLLFLWMTHTPRAVAEPAPPTEGPTAGDLQLALTLTTPAVIEPGADVLVTAVLVNTSRTRTIHVVKPGDGSEAGWREPWVHYSATRLAPDGTTHAVPEVFVGRCGLFDPNWVKDIVALAPGERLDLHSWIPDPSRALALDELGQVQIRMHYVFRGGQADRFREGGESASPQKPHVLAGAAGFEVVSAPITLTIQSPLALRARLRPAANKLRVGRASRLSDLLELAIINTSQAPVTVHSPGTPYTFAFETRPGSFLTGPVLPTPATTPQSATLAPGEALPLLGGRALFSAAGHTDGTWTPTTAGPLTVQVVYHEPGHEPELGRTKRRLVSAPVTFIVAP